MNQIFKRISGIIFLLFGYSISAQILDDTTVLVFGPSTTTYFTENDVYQNIDRKVSIDTIYKYFHRWNYVEKSGGRLQDLGVIGTALRPMFFQLPKNIGATPGFTSFDYYFKNPDDFKYFDTKSPHIDLYLVFGGKGRANTDILFTRNINPNINIGFHFKKVPSDKQIQVSRKGDRRAVSTQYDVFSSFQSNNQKYKALVNVSRTAHKVFESGGVQHTDSTLFIDLFNEEEADVILRNSQSTELRTNLHYYHQYRIKPYLQIFHTIDKYRQVTGFNASIIDELPLYFDNFYINSQNTADSVEFKALQNKLGLKGGEGKLFYSFYLKSRKIDFEYKYQDSLMNYLDTLNLEVDTDFLELYLGGDVSFRLDSSTYLMGNIEFMKGGNHILSASLNHRFIEANVKEIIAEPSFLHRAYYGNHDRWFNDFAPVKGFEFDGKAKFGAKAISFYPSIKFQNVKNHIYFNKDTIPTQKSEGIRVLQAGVSLEFNFLKRFNLSTELIYTTTSGNANDAIKIPELFFNGVFSYSNSILGDNLWLNAGFDIHWNSAYYGYDYYPLLQQYYLQNSFEIPDALSADFFLNMKIGQANVFFKMINLKQLLTDEGYLTAPYYIGQPDAFDFGFRWIFFD